MISSPSFCLKDALHFASKRTNSKKKEENGILPETLNLIRGYSLICYILRCSQQNKIKFLSEMIDEITSWEIINVLVNTLYPVGGKITSYCYTVSPAITYDRYLLDHDRMLDPEILKESITTDLQWFRQLEDEDQLALIQCTGGFVTRIIYHLLKKKLHSMKAPEAGRADDEATQGHFDLTGNEKKQKEWTEFIQKYQNEIEKRKNRGKKGKNKKGKKKQKKDKNSTDWIQLLPVAIVKKILGYLDKKSLKKAGRVDKYWKWVIRDLEKDRKTKKLLEKFQQKYSMDLPDEEEKAHGVNPNEVRLNRLYCRGAICEKLRLKTCKPLENTGVILEALKFSQNETCLNHITVFPRICRSRGPPYTKPRYFFKDVDLITEVVEEREEETVSSLDSFLESGYSKIDN